MSREAEFSKPAHGLVIRSAEAPTRLPGLSLPPARLAAAIRSLIKGAK